MLFTSAAAALAAGRLRACTAALTAAAVTGDAPDAATSIALDVSAPPLAAAAAAAAVATFAVSKGCWAYSFWAQYTSCSAVSSSRLFAELSLLI
jgi:hypothetical protein